MRHALRAGPVQFPQLRPRDRAEEWDRVDPGPPVVPGGQGIGLGSRHLETVGRGLGRTGDGLGPLVCCRKACHKAKQSVGVYSLAAICWTPSTKRPEQALYLPTFSHLMIVNKLPSLSLSLCHSSSQFLFLSPSLLL